MDTTGPRQIVHNSVLYTVSAPGNATTFPVAACHVFKSLCARALLECREALNVECIQTAEVFNLFQIMCLIPKCTQKPTPTVQLDRHFLQV